MSSEGGSFAHLSYHVGGDWQVRCSTYPDATPILSVEGGKSTLSISARGRDADQAAVGFARALAREARRFADEMERKHAAQYADDSTGDNSTDKAAGSDAA